jgi:hypothetical protein
VEGVVAQVGVDQRVPGGHLGQPRREPPGGEQLHGRPEVLAPLEDVPATHPVREVLGERVLRRLREQPGQTVGETVGAGGTVQEEGHRGAR